MSAKNTRLSGLKALALIIITTILGGVGTYILYNIFEYRLPGGMWRPVSLGQDKAASILGAGSEFGTVYVQTSQGKVYVCDSTRCQPTKVLQVSRGHFEGRYSPPPAPGDVVDLLIVPPSCYGLCDGQINFVILSDGSVWNWNKMGCGEIGCLVVLAYPCGGLVLGFFAGSVILVVQRRRQRRRALIAVD